MKLVGWISLVVLTAIPTGAQSPRVLNELTEELKKLEFFVGDWDAEGSVFDAAGEKSSWTGNARGRWALRGRHLRLDATVTTKAGTTESSAMFTWDAHRERYHAIVFSSTDPMPRFVAGPFDGKKLALAGPRAEAGGKLVMEFEKLSDDSYTFSMHMDQEEKNTTLADGKYVRKDR